MKNLDCIQIEIFINLEKWVVVNSTDKTIINYYYEQMPYFKTFFKKKNNKIQPQFLYYFEKQNQSLLLPNGPYSILVSHTLKVKKKEGQCFATSIETLLMHANKFFLYTNQLLLKKVYVVLQGFLVHPLLKFKNQLKDELKKKKNQSKKDEFIIINCYEH